MINLGFFLRFIVNCAPGQQANSKHILGIELYWITIINIFLHFSPLPWWCNG